MSDIVLFLTPTHLDVLTREHTLSKRFMLNGNPVDLQIRLAHTRGDAVAEIERLHECDRASCMVLTVEERDVQPPPLKRTKPWWRHA